MVIRPVQLVRLSICLAMLAACAVPAMSQDSEIIIGANAEIVCSGGADVCAGNRITHPDGFFSGSWCGEPLAINLVSFTASPGPRVIILKWETAAEMGTAGFNLWRQDAGGGETMRVNKSLMPGYGGITWGAAYQVVDRRVSPGRVYTYWLEEVEDSGLASFYGPVTSWPGLAATTLNHR